jgi:VanZ family protein
MSWRTKALLWWLATAAWATQIFLSSTGALSSGHTRSWLRRLLGALDLSLPAESLLQLNLLLRKSAHLLQYGTLAVLLFCALAAHGRWRRPDRQSPPAHTALLTLLLAAAYAATDELHQWFAAERGASAVDWIIDVLGATGAITWLLLRSSAFRPAGARETESSTASIP